MLELIIKSFLFFQTKVFSFMSKSWCAEHFCCYLCDEMMNQKYFFFNFIATHFKIIFRFYNTSYISFRTKFYDLDSKPVCKHCFEKLSSKVRSQIIKSFDNKEKDSKDSSKFLFGWRKDK